MLHLYTFTTPNGYKIPLALEEMQLDYRIHVVNITKGEQHTEEYTHINPNGKIPALVDDEAGLTIFESAVILQYLAEKSGKLLPSNLKDKYAALEWTAWQVANLGPTFGQYAHFKIFRPEKIEGAIQRYEDEVKRLLNILDLQLQYNQFVAGSEFSIADISIYTFVHSFAFYQLEIKDYPAIKRWHKEIAARPAIQTGWQKLKEAAEMVS